MHRRPDCLLTHVEFLQTFCKRTQRIPTGFYGTPRDFQLRNCSPEASRTPQNWAFTVYETAALPLSYTGFSYGLRRFQSRESRIAIPIGPLGLKSPRCFYLH